MPRRPLAAELLCGPRFHILLAAWFDTGSRPSPGNPGFVSFKIYHASIEARLKSPPWEITEKTDCLSES
jgi:hypothetical protein